MDQPAGFVSTTQDERVMAALAHAAIILPNIGVIVPLVIWLTQKDKSRFVAFQALQALAYHVILFIGWFLAIGCYIAFIFGLVFTTAGFSSSTPGLEYGFLLPFLGFGFIMLVSLGFVIYGLIGAVMTLQGRDFHYVFIGDWLARRVLNK
jgi:uncharacterized Tic20 family protein